MSNTYMLPPVVFALVPGMGTVVSKRTAPPSRSIENALVANVAAASMPTAVHNNVRVLSIASLPCFFWRAGAFGSRTSLSVLDSVSTRGYFHGVGTSTPDRGLLCPPRLTPSPAGFETGRRAVRMSASQCEADPDRDDRRSQCSAVTAIKKQIPPIGWPAGQGSTRLRGFILELRRRSGILPVPQNDNNRGGQNDASSTLSHRRGYGRVC